MSYYANTRPTETVSHIVLTGGGGELPGLPEALQEVTRLRVVKGDPLVGLSLAKSAPAEQLRQNSTGLTAALGLALGSAA
ncbi:hypothetical protein GCM10025867_13040 [Frondihabitans sucicola]|uniref:Pilus assembly protein PilM n=1 Tax=Frondihabitans sucicola TaxID=1268041 RepID=A0ABN6XVS0_9MICO|nr:pilus assembly protein PilM [Frondihabitans sucicola]BDZ49063.1 hypothetical protein GCM10025867_13040 [Frondihabitans sucicola]